MLGWIRQALAKSNGKVELPETDAKLPDDLVAAFDAHSVELVSPALRAWCNKSTTPADIEVVMSVAKARGWVGDDLAKLGILIDFYCGNAVAAFEHSRPYMSMDRFDPDLFVICVLSLYENNQFDDAHQFLDLAKGHDDVLADRWDYWFGRALVCWAANDMPGTKQAADRMCELKPDDMTTMENACGMYLELGELARFDELRAAMLARSDQPGYAFALNTLANGQYEEGFRRMEARYEMQEAHRYINRSLFDLPRWRGEDLTGKTLLVSAEQGLGDTIQMARYFPLLRALPGTKIVMETQAPTLTLLQFNFPNMQFVERAYAHLPPVQFDLWTGAMSLPYLFGTTATNVPGRAGYLQVPPDNATYWKERVEDLATGSRLRVGLAWSGQREHRADRRRSVPFALMMRTIESVDADFFALQMHVPKGSPPNLINVSEEMVTLADTAALIAEMDLIITVDTSIVHIAGAIGKETWLLLPYRYEWRWGFEGEGNRWYDSVRVLRQERHGDWGSLLESVFDHRLPEWQKRLETKQ